MGLFKYLRLCKVQRMVHDDLIQSRDHFMIKAHHQRDHIVSLTNENVVLQKKLDHMQAIVINLTTKE